MPADNPPVMLVRLRREHAPGERARTVHIVSLPATDTPPIELAAYCGAQFAPGTLELLSGPTGMPCTACLIAALQITALVLPPGV